jgi:hypothetical protein
MNDSIPRTHANLIAGIAPKADLGNLPGVAVNTAEERQEQLMDFMKMIERMGGVDHSLSTLHLQDMFERVDRFFTDQVGADWREFGLPLHLPMIESAGKMMTAIRDLWSWTHCSRKSVDNLVLLPELIRVVIASLSLVLVSVPVANLKASLHPDHIITKMVNVFNATWNHHHDVMLSEGIHVSQEGMILTSYLDEMSHALLARSPVEVFSIAGAVLSVLGINPDVIYGGTAAILHLDTFRIENGSREASYSYSCKGGVTDDFVIMEMLGDDAENGFKLFLGPYAEVRSKLAASYNA